MGDMRWAALLFVGCSFRPGTLTGDAPSPPDTPGGCVTYSSLFDTCTVGVTLPTSALTLTAGVWTYNTDDNMLMPPAGSPITLPHADVPGGAGALQVVFVASLTIEPGATLRAGGPNMDRGLWIA